MDKIQKKMEQLMEDLDLLLYYDKEELDKISLEEVAFEKGKEEGEYDSKIKIAKNLLELNIPLKDVMKATGLTKEEIEKIEE